MDDDLEDVPDAVHYFKVWQLVDRFGWTPSQIEDECGEDLDWVLAIDRVMNEKRPELPGAASEPIRPETM